MRQTITQEGEMGCGAACVAFAAEVPYRDAVNVLGKTKAQHTGFHLKELVEALHTYGFVYKSSHINRLKRELIYNNGVIVFIKRSKRYPFGHYIIRHNGLWADSWINLAADKNIANAKSGYRQRLPGEAQWVVYPHQLLKK